jgi:sugar phosphate permease
LAFAFVALTVASSTGVDEANHGTAGGLINMTQQIGGAIGLAVVTAVATSRTHGIDAISLTDGFRSALLVSAGIAAAAIVTTMVVLPRSPRRTSATPASAVVI